MLSRKKNVCLFICLVNLYMFKCLFYSLKVVRWSSSDDTSWTLRAPALVCINLRVIYGDCSGEGQRQKLGGYLHTSRFLGTQPTTYNTKTGRKASSWLKSQVGIPDLETWADELERTWLKDQSLDWLRVQWIKDSPRGACGVGWAKRPIQTKRLRNWHDCNSKDTERRTIAC